MYRYNCMYGNEFLEFICHTISNNFHHHFWCPFPSDGPMYVVQLLALLVASKTDSCNCSFRYCFTKNMTLNESGSWFGQ